MNFCKDCVYYSKEPDRYNEGYSRDWCYHPKFGDLNYITGVKENFPSCAKVRSQWEPECKYYQKAETFWEWLKRVT